MSIVGVVALAAGAYYFSNTEQATHLDTVEDHHDTAAAHEIYPGTVAEKIERGEDVILLDVRTPEEYEEVHIENAVLLPVQQLSAQSLTDVGLGENAKDKEIIIYCRSGARSETAYSIMESLGYTNIQSVAGGMVHWQEDQYPFTESGPYMGQSYELDEAPTEASGGADISIDPKEHDFGVIPQYGGTVETTFTVTNAGTEVLEIGELMTSCSCTSASISGTSIAPGDSATLTVVFDPDFHEEPEGRFTRTVYIPSNDPDTPEAEVVIRVDIAEGE